MKSNEVHRTQGSYNSGWCIVDTQKISAGAVLRQLRLVLRLLLLLLVLLVLLLLLVLLCRYSDLTLTLPCAAWRSRVPQICLARGSALRGLRSYKKGILINYATWKLTCH